MYSFIVPIYNAEKYLTKCIDSILNQSEEFEIILVNDGSSDSSAQICELYKEKDSRIKVIHQINQGVSVARNKGIEQAKGEWIIFLDADDWIEHDFCKETSKILCDDIDICFCGYKEEASNLTKTHIDKEMRIGEWKYLGRNDIEVMQEAILDKALCNYTSVGAPWAKIFRTSIIREHGIRYIENMVKGEDHIFNIEFFEYSQKAIFINFPFYHYRITATSARHKYNPNIISIIQKQYKLIWELLKKIQKDERYAKSYYKAVFRRFMIDSLIDFCHEDNPKSYVVRKCDFMNAISLELFATAENKIKLNSDWPLIERILGTLIKLRMFGMICLLVKVKKHIYRAH